MSLPSAMLGPAGEELDYSRFDNFGYPYFGTPPLIPDHELQSRSKTSYRVGFGVFNTDRVAERRFGRTYGEILEGLINQQFRLIRQNPVIQEPDGSFTLYVEWAEPYAHDKNNQLPARIGIDIAEAEFQAQAKSPKKRKRLKRSRQLLRLLEEDDAT